VGCEVFVVYGWWRSINLSGIVGSVQRRGMYKSNVRPCTGGNAAADMPLLTPPSMTVLEVFDATDLLLMSGERLYRDAN
jgi:hypothetical protein